MKYIFYIIIGIIFLSSCTHRVVRTGYTKNKESYSNCEVAIKRFMHQTEYMEKVGEVKLGESGFSTSCSEERALEILKKEACSLNADIINIIEERRPDVMSSCYRCRAEFYRYTDPEIVIQSDESYHPAYVTQRVAKDRKNNSAMVVSGVVIGLLLGFLSAL